jgi:hypothetical protein
MKTIEIIKKKLHSMRYSKKDVQNETSLDAKQFIYGYTECINDLLEYIHQGGDGLPEHELPKELPESIKDQIIGKLEEYVKHLKIMLKMKKPAKGTTSEHLESDITELKEQIENPERPEKKPKRKGRYIVKVKICAGCGSFAHGNP